MNAITPKVPTNAEEQNAPETKKTKPILATALALGLVLNTSVQDFFGKVRNTLRNVDLEQVIAELDVTPYMKTAKKEVLGALFLEVDTAEASLRETGGATEEKDRLAAAEAKAKELQARDARAEEGIKAAEAKAKELQARDAAAEKGIKAAEAKAKELQARDVAAEAKAKELQLRDVAADRFEYFREKVREKAEFLAQYKDKDANTLSLNIRVQIKDNVNILKQYHEELITICKNGKNDKMCDIGYLNSIRKLIDLFDIVDNTGDNKKLLATKQ